MRAQFDVRLEVAAQAVDAVNRALKRITVDPQIVAAVSQDILEPIQRAGVGRFAD